MPTSAFLTCDPSTIKQEITRQIEHAVDWLYAAACGLATPRHLEHDVGRAAVFIAQQLLEHAFAVRCRASTLADVASRGLSADVVRLRMDDDYVAKLTTTWGAVVFPMFAYRDHSASEGSVTRVPARTDVLPLYERCRSSEVLVEWETRLGAAMAYRQAQAALTFFTRGAVTVEDTTIARHTVAVGELVDRAWQYRSVPDIKATLTQRARRDALTGRPIVYLSTDACAQRRFVDETWDAGWKMANGVRLWCVDDNTGRIVHLGGEYTWGDCAEVEAILGHLDRTGILPFDGDYGNGLQAQIAIPTDGIDWIRERVVPLYAGVIAVLDPWHLMERLAKEAAGVFGEKTAEAHEWYDDAILAMFGTRPTRSKKPRAARRGHKKRRRQAPGARPHGKYKAGTHDSTEALATLLCDTYPTGDYAETYEKCVQFFKRNVDRIGYAELRRRGFQIGSGAMEALHRVAGHARLKLPGARWLERTSAAIFALRMLSIVDRWDEFWTQPDLARRLAVSLASTRRP